MPLLDDEMLSESPVVANCRMNRERNLYGANGYARDLRYDPMQILREAVTRHGTAAWLDLCCGTATALVEASVVVEREQLPLEVVGVDLAGLFVPHTSPRLTLHEADLSDWQPDRQFDLITCVHGLHYIGDKLGLVAKAARWLLPDGRFTAHLDITNVRLKDGRRGRAVARALRSAGFEYCFRNRLVELRGVCGSPLHYRYLGADDAAGPNYTGQPAVHSWYEDPTS